MTNEVTCPKCEGILQPEFGGLTCGCCGYGRHTCDEFDELQATLKENC